MHRYRDAGAPRKNLDGVSEPESLGDHDEVDGRPSRAAGVAAPPLFAVAADEHRHRGRLPGLGTVARGGAWPRGRAAVTLRWSQRLFAERRQIGPGEDLVSVVPHSCARPESSVLMALALPHTTALLPVSFHALPG